MALRRKCQQIGDLRIAALRKLEHLFRRLDLLIQDVVMQRTAHLFPEEPGPNSWDADALPPPGLRW